MIFLHVFQNLTGQSESATLCTSGASSSPAYVTAAISMSANNEAHKLDLRELDYDQQSNKAAAVHSGVISESVVEEGIFISKCYSRSL